MKIAPITDVDRKTYRESGYFILRQVIPASLLTDLRREAAKAHAIAVRLHGPQTQRLAPLRTHEAELDLKPFRDFTQIEGLNAAVQALLTPEHFLKPTEDGCILFGPRERPWSDRVAPRLARPCPGGRVPGRGGRCPLAGNRHRLPVLEPGQLPLYEDISTWYVPSSFKRVHNTPEEMRVYASTTQQELWDEDRRRTNEEQEEFCLRYCQAMPGAVRLVLDPGDFAIYRNVGWHIGNYVPYRQRATISTHCITPAFAQWAAEHNHLLKAVEAGVERHARMAAVN